MVLECELRGRHFFVPLVALKHSVSRLVNSGVLIGKKSFFKTTIPIPFEAVGLTDALHFNSYISLFNLFHNLSFT